MRERLQESSDLTGRETLVILGRALRYVAPFRSAFLAKLGLLLLTLIPTLLLPWPGKVVIDHVVEQHPIGEGIYRYPFFLEPLLTRLQGADPMTVLAWAVAAQILLERGLS